MFSARVVPEDFANGLDGRFLVVLDGTGAARYRSSPVPEELVQLFGRRAPNTVDAPGGTTILAWFAAGREWRGALTYLPSGHFRQSELGQTPSWCSRPRRLSA